MGIVDACVAAVLGLIVTAVVAAVGRQLQSEFQDWTPKATDRLVERAVRRLPEDKQERFREEWAAHLEDTPGEVWKWRVAVGYLFAARRMAPRSVLFPTLRLRAEALDARVRELMYGGTDLGRAKALLSAYAALLREVALISVPNFESISTDIAHAIVRFLRRRGVK